MNAYLQFWINEFGSDMLATWDRGFERWQHVWGGYWSNFSITIIMICLIVFIIFILYKFMTDGTYTFNILCLKITLGFLVFFIIVYGCLVIVTLIGEVGIGSFCTVLREINMGNRTMFDQLPQKYTSYSKIILKECTQGLNGRIEKFFPVYATSSNAAANGFIT